MHVFLIVYLTSTEIWATINIGIVFTCIHYTYCNTIIFTHLVHHYHVSLWVDLDGKTFTVQHVAQYELFTCYHGPTYFHRLNVPESPVKLNQPVPMCDHVITIVKREAPSQAPCSRHWRHLAQSPFEKKMTWSPLHFKATDIYFPHFITRSLLVTLRSLLLLFELNVSFLFSFQGNVEYLLKWQGWPPK